MPSAVFALATGLGVSFGLTPVARRLALSMGVIDRPGPRKVHLTPMPLLGGMAIYVGTVLAILLFIDRSAWGEVVGIIAGATMLWVVGTLDDCGLLHPQIKLMITMPIAALVLITSGIHATVFESLSPSSLLLVADLVLTLLWVVGINGAFNILDHMDGLCAGTAALASGFFLLFAVVGGQVLVGTLAAAILGASLGFLRWNFSPAKIFMGDGGAIFLGFMLATLGLKVRFPHLPHATSWMIPVLILGVPIFDTTLVTISRARRGLLPFASPGKDHTAHRLTNLGLGQRRAVLLLYVLGGLFGLLALLVSRIPVGWSYALAATVVAVGLLSIVALEAAPYEDQVRNKA
jgi:UDP-GlcNAc:undecaprenyl-phosphate GlcNAc-1-phosphate transferase